ncbi:MAG: SUMF1/EgtB/PvdO family nonheme iron enzyme [Bacteroidales bacterium]|nr:SUMF1/EgtB/PvdO family nonheme iron enzyme [Bacteroidales bacterium]
MISDLPSIINDFFHTYSEISMNENEIQKLRSSDSTISIWNYNEKTFTDEKQKYLIVIPFQEIISISNVVISDRNAIEFSFDEKSYYVGTQYTKIFFIDIFNQYKDDSTGDLRLLKTISTEVKKTVVFETPKEFYKKLFNFENYQNFFSEDLEFRKVNKFYIDRKIKPIVQHDKELATDNHLQLVLHDWSENQENRNILLIGDRGMGKSWAVMNYCINQYKKHEANPWIIPPALFIILKIFNEDKIKKSGMMKAILHHVKIKYKINFLLGDASLEALIKMGKLILVLDGYDDMNKYVNSDTTHYQLFEIYSVIHESSSLILTSRMNYFDSMMKIYEHFSFSRYKEIKIKTGLNKKSIAFTSTYIRSDFNIWRLDNMDESEKNKLSEKYKTSNNKSQLGEEILSSINKKKAKSFIEKEIVKISSIPAFRFAIIKLLEYGDKPLIHIYRDSIIMAVIGYNLTTERSIEQYTERFGKDFSDRPLDLDRKWSALENLSWYMFEKRLNPINKNDLKKFLLKHFEIDFEEIFNDIKTQTVIKLAENENEELYSYLSHEVFAFFISSFLYKSIADKDNLNNGYKLLGKYNLDSSQTGKSILNFLNLLLNADKELAENSERIVTKLLSELSAFSFYTKYLVSNLEAIKINSPIIKSKDSWSNSSITVEDGLVLISREHSFKISQYPVTNKEFKNFLDSKSGEKWRMKIDEERHKKFQQFKIDYHLYMWKNDTISINELQNPLVYIGWYAAIAYCNWRSEEENISPPYYSFAEEKNGDITINKNLDSLGYRLPSINEWHYVASECNTKLKYPWEKLKNLEQFESYKSALMDRPNVIRSILDFEQNDLGVFGMIGEIKEWVDNHETDITTKKHRPIKGSTILTDYDLQRIIEIPGQNTNVDVGFRVAKSLSKDELEQTSKLISQ